MKGRRGVVRPSGFRRGVVAVLGCAAAAVVLGAALEWKEFAAAWYIRDLGSDDPGVRTQAATRLGELGSVRAVPGLLQILDDVSPPGYGGIGVPTGKYRVDSIHPRGVDPLQPGSALKAGWWREDAIRFICTVTAEPHPVLEPSRFSFDGEFMTVDAPLSVQIRIRDALRALQDIERKFRTGTPDGTAARIALIRIGEKALPFLVERLQDCRYGMWRRAIAFLAISEIEWNMRR
jgi:HEAT repeat protein